MSRDLTHDELVNWLNKEWLFTAVCQTCQKPNGRYWCDECEKSSCNTCGDGDKLIACPLHD